MKRRNRAGSDLAKSLTLSCCLTRTSDCGLLTALLAEDAAEVAQARRKERRKQYFKLKIKIYVDHHDSFDLVISKTDVCICKSTARRKDSRERGDALTRCWRLHLRVKIVRTACIDMLLPHANKPMSSDDPSLLQADVSSLPASFAAEVSR